MAPATPGGPGDGLLDDSLAAPFTRLDDDHVRAVLHEGWGLEPTAIARLDTERDDTFRIDADGRYVLKVAHPLDDPGLLDLQCTALLHIAARDPGLPVSHLRPDLHGRVLHPVDRTGEPRLARLLGWLHGTELDYDATTPEQRRAVGAALGRLSLALADFEHPAADRALPWDLQQAGTLRPLLPFITDERARADAATMLDRYDAGLGAALHATRQHVLHNDLNPDNVVVDPDDPRFVTGILDFGDMVRTAVVADLAVCIAYAAGSAASRDPWAPAYDVADGYLAVRPLLDDELALLPDLVRLRLAQRQLVNSWLASTDPANAHYTGRSLAASALVLRAVVATEPRGER